MITAARLFTKLPSIVVCTPAIARRAWLLSPSLPLCFHTHKKKMSASAAAAASSSTHPQSNSALVNAETKKNNTTTSPTRLTQGSVTHFLSPDYRIPFPALTSDLSFNDTSSWPEDPMHVFSQWYCDAEFAFDAYTQEKDSAAPLHWPNTMQVATVTGSGFPSVRTVLLKGFDSRGLIFFTNYEGNKGSQLLQDGRVAVNFYWKTLERQVRMQGIAEKLPEDESDAYFHTRPIASQISGTVSPQSRPIYSHTELEEHYVHTVEQIAKQIEAILSSSDQNKANATEAEIAATKAKVSELLGALSVKASAAAKAAQHAQHLPPSSGPVTSEKPSAEEVDKALAAHKLALASLQRLEANPLTAPLLKAVVKRPPYWGGFVIRPQHVEFWCDGAFRLHSRIVYERSDRDVGESSRISSPTNAVQWRKKFWAP